jgi:hypothetical protein
MKTFNSITIRYYSKSTLFLINVNVLKFFSAQYNFTFIVFNLFECNQHFDIFFIKNSDLFLKKNKEIFFSTN